MKVITLILSINSGMFRDLPISVLTCCMLLGHGSAIKYLTWSFLHFLFNHNFLNSKGLFLYKLIKQH